MTIFQRFAASIVTVGLVACDGLDARTAVELRGQPVRNYRADVRLTPDGAGTLIVWGATFEPLIPGTGRLLSAVWDPWASLPAHRDELARSDVYTLRRIVPADRGLPWDRT